MGETAADVFDDITRRRRSVRVFDADIAVPEEVMERSLQRAVLSPNSSNLQLWEFYWVRDAEKRDQMSDICLGQNAARTAAELVVVVARRDLWDRRRRAVLASQLAYFESIREGELSRGQKLAMTYYERIVPAIYRSGGGVLDVGKRLMTAAIGLRKPIMRGVSRRDVDISVHRSVALAAMTFMHSITAEGFDTCPLEGFDEVRLKRLLGLPAAASVSMVVAVGARTDKGIYGPQFRVPIEEVVHRV